MSKSIDWEGVQGAINPFDFECATSETLLPATTTQLTCAHVYVTYVRYRSTYTGTKLTWSLLLVNCGLQSKR